MQVFRIYITFLLVILASQSWAAIEEDVQFDTGTGILYGTLMVPESTGPHPVVLIHSGSGPTDRDGNSAIVPGQNNSLKQLAQGLADLQIASLRYDKRAIGQSRSAGLSEWDLRFDIYIDDATGWCRWLQNDGRFSSVTVAGHSEGAQIGANAAWLAGADGLVSMAGAGRPIFDVIKEQLARSLPVRNRVKADAVMEKLARGELVEEPPVEVSIFFRPSVQPYLISWQKYDPQESLARFDGPVAIVQGTTDIQVSMVDAEILAEAQPRADLVILENANHIFKYLEGRNPIEHQMSIADSTTTIVPEVITTVANIARQADDYRQAKEQALGRIKKFHQSGSSSFKAAGESTGERVGQWARHYLNQGGDYLFGLAEGGYASEGKLRDEASFDCVSFMYQCTENARSRNQDEALAFALRTRFAGADPAAVVDASGRADYDAPEHLDFSLDMIRTGIWGRNVTALMTGAVDDAHGSSRYEADSFQFIPKADLQDDELREGDIVWLVLDPEHKKGAAMREKFGLVVGHIGIVLREDGQAQLAHAASSSLPGFYEKSGLVQVPLKDYLDQVGKFAGIMVTRLN